MSILSSDATMTAEFDLACDREWLLRIIRSVFFLGSLLGYVLLGRLADIVGRRKVS